MIGQRKVLLVGGGGYVGVELQRFLAESNYHVRVLDTFWYPNGKWANSDGGFVNQIEYIDGDIRDRDVVNKALIGMDACIHLACISNDPSYELNPNLGRSINFDSFGMFVEEINKSSIKTLIYASSSSVYGVKEEEKVTEELICEPLTDYSKYNARCEEIILNESLNDKVVTIVRPATVCGYSTRQRLDLVVNILTTTALVHNEIKVFGGKQYRPNLHIADMVESYLALLEASPKSINQEVFNIGSKNLTVREIAEAVREEVGKEIEIQFLETNDLRSYRVDSSKIQKHIGFSPKFTVNDAIKDLKNNFGEFKSSDPLSDPRYINIARMKELKLG